MRASHVIYAVMDLDAAVRDWRERGFCVEYGKPKHPFNALIYFSTGPFIELIQVQKTTRMVRFFISLSKFIGLKHVHARFKKILNSEHEGWIDFCIEQDAGDLRPSIERVNRLGFSGNHLKHSNRRDTHGNNLKFQNYFPDDPDMPFLMSYYSIDPKPQNYVHPNGVSHIQKIRLSTSQRCADAIAALSDDPCLEVSVANNGLKIHSVDFGYVAK
ncbi:MAG: VOC family protein [Eubacteriales bacterium]|nr:VOC family protein [Eubacteriales bacterium]